MRKRRNRGTWLPTKGAILTEGGDATLAGIFFGMPYEKDDISSIILPVTADAPSYQGDSGSITDGTIMADVIGNEYFLDRIVGKIFLANRPPQYSGSPPTYEGGTVLVGAGFFVARADDAQPAQPVGAGNAAFFSAEMRDNYSVLESDTIREPWIWRRTWLLGSGGAAPEYQNGATDASHISRALPASNTHYGSVLDGPHIDAKTKRRIGQEDRLWFTMSASYMPQWGNETGVPDNQGTIFCALDYRLHGALRRARPTGRF